MTEDRNTNTRQGIDERIGRLVAAGGAGTEGLTDEELAGLRTDLEGLLRDADQDLEGRKNLRQAAREDSIRIAQEKPKERRRISREVLRAPLPESAEAWAEYQYRSCGRSNCKVCRGSAVGGGHGPYWVIMSHVEKNRHVGRKLSDEGARLLAAVEVRRQASTHRVKLAMEIRVGDRDDLLEVEDFDPDYYVVERPGWQTVFEDLVREWSGKTPEEVFPERFNPEQVERARQQRIQREQRDQEQVVEAQQEAATPGTTEAQAEPEDSPETTG